MFKCNQETITIDLDLCEGLAPLSACSGSFEVYTCNSQKGREWVGTYRHLADAMAEGKREACLLSSGQVEILKAGDYEFHSLSVGNRPALITIKAGQAEVSWGGDCSHDATSHRLKVIAQEIAEVADAFCDDYPDWAELDRLGAKEGALKEEQRSLRAAGCSGFYPSRASLARDAAEAVEHWDELLAEEHAFVLADMKLNPVCKRMPWGECLDSIPF